MRNWPHLDRTGGPALREGEPVQMTGLAIEERGGAARKITFRASTMGVDRHKTRIDPEGLDTANFEKNPIFLWGHDGYGGFFSVPQMENILGRVPSFRKSKDAFDIDVDFAVKDVNPKADMAFRMVQAGFLNAVSIGFIPRQIVRNVNDENDVPIIAKAELLEVSLVPIPSNPDALALSRSMMDADVRSRDQAQLGWVCKHGQFYNNPAQAEKCYGHDPDHQPPEQVQLDAAEIGDMVKDALAETELRGMFRSAIPIEN